MKSAAKWVLGVILAVCLVGVGAVLVSPLLGNVMNPLGTKSETINTQVVNAITRTEEVALLSLGIQGIEQKTRKMDFFGVDIPGSERALYLQYSFTAKLGIDGKQVKIEPLDDKSFRIAIPAFTFIGHDDVTFGLAVESNGALSWTTPEIDTIEMTNSILNDDAQQKYLDSYQELLREQAKAFYRGIITGIDPAIDLEFAFANGS